MVKTLDEQKNLVSRLWLDQPDAHARIDDRVDSARLDPTQAASLRDFLDRGATTIRLDRAPDFFSEFDDGIDQLWQSRPTGVAYDPPGPQRRRALSEADESADRVPGYRLDDVEDHLPIAASLYADDQVGDFISLILDQPAYAFQSLYFEWGSEQSLHRDPMFLATSPPSHLVAAWTALEDITPESGPLTFVPGSHRWPWFEFAPDSVLVRKRGGDPELRREWARTVREQVEQSGTEPEVFTCHKGEVLIFHAGLVHGGLPLGDENHTRKSYVTHYSTRWGRRNLRQRARGWLRRPGSGRPH